MKRVKNVNYTCTDGSVYAELNNEYGSFVGRAELKEGDENIVEVGKIIARSKAEIRYCKARVFLLKRDIKTMKSILAEIDNNCELFTGAYIESQIRSKEYEIEKWEDAIDARQCRIYAFSYATPQRM